jgi:hypothetical protein
MDVPTAELLARMPLAEAVLWLWRWVADEEHLGSLFHRYRKRCYERVISFATMVQLIADALLKYGGSGHRSFSRARESAELEASLTAAYGKLSRIPVPLSMGFLRESADRLRTIFPDGVRRTVPPSVQEMTPVILDGKAIKRVAKRLKKLRGAKGGMLGGRALVALEFTTGLAMAMHAHPDGDANDVRFVPELLPEVRQRISGARLWIADRQFCDLIQIGHFTEHGDHFLVRYNAKVGFHADASRPAQEGQNRQGRQYLEEWGWLGRASHKQRRYVRRITLLRPGEEELGVVTDLLEADSHPAHDLLELYLQRWGIERMFQKVTEVFGLEGLIGGTPEATIFQFAFCLLLYNQIEVVRAYIAQHQAREVETISLEKLFTDVQQELIAWNVVVPRQATLAHFAETSAADICRHLRRLLGSRWSDRWIKSVNKQRRSHPPRARHKTHGSVYRILNGIRSASKRKHKGKARSKDV